MRRTRAWLATLALLALAACSGSPANTGASGKTPAATPTATTAAGGASLDNPLQLPGASPGSTGLPSHRPAHSDDPCFPEILYSTHGGLPGGNFIRAATRAPVRWGPHCEVLTPGDRCEVQWDGSYSLMAGDEAYLTFQAWAKGQNKPFKELTAGPVPPENQLRHVGFPVIIPTTESVAFRIVVLNQAKVPVLISDAYVYKVKCKPELA